LIIHNSLSAETLLVSPLEITAREANIRRECKIYLNEVDRMLERRPRRQLAEPSLIGKPGIRPLLPDLGLKSEREKMSWTELIGEA
jgi:hypothetical protein